MLRFLRRLLIALATLSVWSAGLAAHAQVSPAAQEVLNRARTATGGAAAWNAVRGLHETGQEGEARYERWLDPLRYGLRIETKSATGKLVQGYNGAGEWRILPSGTPTGSIAPEVLAKMRSDAFFGTFGFYFPGRFDMRGSLLGVRQHDGRSYDVVRMQPAGGAPRELWFEREGGLLGRIVDQSGDRTTAVELSDYRRVGKLKVPFLYVTSGGDLAQPKVRKVEAMDLRPADRALFSLPRAP